jgi:hypothetical protein
MAEFETAAPLSPTATRYIKLGAGARWLRDCSRDGIIRFGFQTQAARRFEICTQRNWTDLMEDLLAEGRPQGAATNIVN